MSSLPVLHTGRQVCTVTSASAIWCSASMMAQARLLSVFFFTAAMAFGSQTAPPRPATLNAWRDRFLAGGETGLKSREADVEDEERRRLKSVVASVSVENELLREKIARMENGHVCNFGSSEIWRFAETTYRLIKSWVTPGVFHAETARKHN